MRAEDGDGRHGARLSGTGTLALPAMADDRGLTEAEARARLSERPPARRTSGSRSYRSIVRANVFTVFNLILAAFGGLTLVYGDWRDALFLGILVANTGDRDRPGGAREARARPALRARGADRDRRARRRARGGCTWTRS